MKKLFRHSLSSLNKKFRWFPVVFLLVILGVFFFLITLQNVFTETYQLERFNSPDETIRSPITIEHEQETKRKIRETVQAVEDRYNISEEITAERIAYVEEIFEAVEEVEKAENKTESLKAAEDTGKPVESNHEKVQQLKQILSPEITEYVNDGAFYNLFDANKTSREKGKKLIINSLTKAFESGVRVENIQSAITEIEQHIKYSDLDSSMKEALKELNKFAVAENSFFDVEATMEARKEAASNVEPVLIRAGEIIVRQGQPITNEIYEKLKLVGLLDAKRNVFPVIGLALLICLIVAVITFEIKRVTDTNEMNKGKVVFIVLISVLIAAIMKVVSLFTTPVNELIYIVPVATGSLLIKMLLEERLAIVLAIVYAILGSVIFNNFIPGSLNMEAGVYFFFSQMAGIIFLQNMKDRLAILKAGMGMTVVNIVLIAIFLFLSIEKYTWDNLLTHAGFAVIAAFLSIVLALGLLPFFEMVLGLVSDSKLLALASPNQPLLRKILTEAPGTYHHSIMVANLSETACDTIGANGLLARVGAYYHDIGKTVRAHYFIENQLSIRNPHDVIEPIESAKIIISHPYDGAAILKKHKLPKEIVDIATQHHGTTLMKYFYFMERERNPNTPEKDFRYPGPKPQTKEAAIICICDSVEAAVRSLKEPTEEKIDEIVASIVNDRLMDGQLNECPLTLNELDKVHQTICKTLKGIFHSRIQYPIKEAK